MSRSLPTSHAAMVAPIIRLLWHCSALTSLYRARSVICGCLSRASRFSQRVCLRLHRARVRMIYALEVKVQGGQATAASAPYGNNKSHRADVNRKGAGIINTCGPYFCIAPLRSRIYSRLRKIMASSTYKQSDLNQGKRYAKRCKSSQLQDLF